MKKVLSALMILSGVILFAGCQNEPTTIPTVPVQETSFIVEVRALNDVVLFSETIIFDEEEDKTTLAWIEEHIALDYDVYDIGIFVNGIEDYYPTEFGVTYNYWFQLLIDEQPVNYGLEGVTLSDGMTITFKEATMLDAVDLAVDRAIQDFLKYRLITYINKFGIHYGIAMALQHLELKGYTIPSMESMAETMPTFNRGTISEMYKTVAIEKVFGLDTTTTEDMLIEAETTNVYEAISLLNALTILGHESTQVEALLDLITADLPVYMDADYAGMAIAALSSYLEDEDVDAYIENLLDYIGTKLTTTGVEAYGEANPASTAQVVLGLVSMGINPRSEAYELEGIDLIEALLLYENDGQFYKHMDDSLPELVFSTPQGIMALIMYKIYRDTWGNPPVELHRMGA